jgi:hypothetical protein
MKLSLRGGKAVKARNCSAERLFGAGRRRGRSVGRPAFWRVANGRTPMTYDVLSPKARLHPLQRQSIWCDSLLLLL